MEHENQAEVRLCVSDGLHKQHCQCPAMLSACALEDARSGAGPH